MHRATYGVGRCKALASLRMSRVSFAILGALSLPLSAANAQLDATESSKSLLDYAYSHSGGAGAITDVEPLESDWTDKPFTLSTLPIALDGQTGEAIALEETQDTAALSAPLTIGFGNEESGWLLWDRETHYVENEMTESYNPSGDWFGQMNDHHDSDTNIPSAEDRRARASTTAEPLVIDLIWTNPLDLDLHVFEPTALADGQIRPKQPGHIWSKAPQQIAASAQGRLQVYPFDAERRISAERYVVTADAGQSMRRVQVFVDYSDRTRRGNNEPRTCGSGDYATLKAQLRVTLPKGTMRYPVEIPAIACGTPVSISSAMIPVGVVRFQ